MSWRVSSAYRNLSRLGPPWGPRPARHPDGYSDALYGRPIRRPTSPSNPWRHTSVTACRYPPGSSCSIVRPPGESPLIGFADALCESGVSSSASSCDMNCASQCALDVILNTVFVNDCRKYWRRTEPELSDAFVSPVRSTHIGRSQEKLPHTCRVGKIAHNTSGQRRWAPSAPQPA